VNQNQGIAMDSALTAMNIPHKFVFMEKQVMHKIFSVKKETALFIRIFWIG
jgi:hypothetical protein